MAVYAHCVISGHIGKPHPYSEPPLYPLYLLFSDAEQPLARIGPWHENNAGQSSQWPHTSVVSWTMNVPGTN